MLIYGVYFESPVTEQVIEMKASKEGVAHSHNTSSPFCLDPKKKAMACSSLGVAKRASFEKLELPPTGC